MAFTFRAGSEANNVVSGTPTANVVINKPTGVVDGDIMFACLASSTSYANSVPSGWISLGQQIIVTTRRIQLWYKIASSEPSTYTWGNPSVVSSDCVIAAYYGDFDPTNPIDVVSNTVYATSNTTVRAAGMTVGSINSALIWIGAPFTNTTIAKPTALATWAYDYNSAINGQYQSHVCSLVWTSKGATGNVDGTLGAGTTGKHAFMVALRPAPPANNFAITWDAIANVPVADATSVANWNTFFNLPTNGTAITSVKVIDNTVYFVGGASISLATEILYANTHVVSIVDLNGYITVAGDSSIRDCTALTSLKLYGLTTAALQTFQGNSACLLNDMPALTTIGNYGFYGNSACTSFVLTNLATIGTYCFNTCSANIVWTLRKLTSAPTACFDHQTVATTYYLDELLTTGDYVWTNNTNNTTFYMPKVTNLGSTVGNDGMFGSTGKTMDITVPLAMQTCNSGGVEGDIAWLIANNTVTMHYISSTLIKSFNSLLKASIKVVDSTAIAAVKKINGLT